MTRIITNQLRIINRRLDNLKRDDIPEMFYIADKLESWDKSHRIPAELGDALLIKFTKIMDGTWYGDEETETVIKAYIN